MSAGAEHDVTRLRPSWVRKINVAKVQDIVPGECWLWTGADNGKGYGLVNVNKKLCYLHRFTYERFIGPIPDRLQLDHLCRQHACCAPHHLEPVTGLANVRRGSRATQTHCKRRHALAGDNLYIWTDRAGRAHRTCRECRDANMAEWRVALAERKRQTWAKYLPVSA